MEDWKTGIPVSDMVAEESCNGGMVKNGTDIMVPTAQTELELRGSCMEW